MAAWTQSILSISQRRNPNAIGACLLLSSSQSYHYYWTPLNFLQVLGQPVSAIVQILSNCTVSKAFKTWILLRQSYSAPVQDALKYELRKFSRARAISPYHGPPTEAVDQAWQDLYHCECLSIVSSCQTLICDPKLECREYLKVRLHCSQTERLLYLERRWEIMRYH
jgi:hypothetical protein